MKQHKWHKEPVAKIVKQPFHDEEKSGVKSTPMIQWFNGEIPPIDTLLYIHPKEWQGLGAEEIASLAIDEQLCQKVERILKEKNHGTT